MLRTFDSHGLKQSFRLVATCGHQLLLAAPLPHRTRRYNGHTTGEKGIRGSSEGERTEKNSTGLTFLTDVHFQGFPHLEGKTIKQEQHNGDDNGSGEPLATRESDADWEGFVKKPEDPTNKDNRPATAPASRRVNFADLSSTSSNQEYARHNGTVEGSTRRRLMRDLRKPPRFRPLLREVRRVGPDSPRRNLEPKTGKLKKILSRSALSTEALQAELRWIVQTSVTPKSVENILKILVEQRKLRPTLDHYEALILSQCFPEYGSIESVKTILQEMEREDVPCGQSVLLAVLTVLAVHPDTYLRDTVLIKLKSHQYALDDHYAHLNILALIREEQLELATIELERLSQKNQGTAIPDWLWTIYMHAICDLRSDFDALLQLMYRLSDSGFVFLRPTLLHLLQRASQAGDIHVTKFVWHGYVESMHIIPNEELCLSALRVAAKEKDLKLAESVAVVLESVTGNSRTDPPSREDVYRSSRRKQGILTNNSPELLGPESSKFQGASQASKPEGLFNTAPTMAAQVRSASEVEADPSSTGSSPGDHQDPNYASLTPLSAGWNPLEHRDTSDPPSPSPQSDSGSDSDPDLANAFSTSPPLPDPSLPPPPRTLPPEALTLLSSLGITDFDPEPSDNEGVSWIDADSVRQAAGSRRRKRRKPVKGILYPLFREEGGLAGARFDPRLALLQVWDWRNK